MRLGIAVINNAEVRAQPAVPIRGTDLCEVILKSENGRIEMLTNNDLSNLKLSDSEAFEKAEAVRQHFSIRTLPEVIGIELHNAGYENNFADEAAMSFDTARDVYVLTNDSNMFGASVLIQTDVLRELHRSIGDYYILPSSKHEVLAVSKQLAPPVDELRAMVQTINESEVRIEDRLSNNVYLYDGKTLSMARDNSKTTDTEISKIDGRIM